MQHYNVTIAGSLDDPQLRPYRTLRRSVEHIQIGIFVAEGERVVRRLLASALEVVSILVTKEWYERLEADKELGRASSRARASSTPIAVFIASKELLQTIVGYRLHQGIMAVGRVPASPRLEQMAEWKERRHLMVALDGLVNSENVGVVVRNAAAFGADAIIVGETASSPYLRRAVRNSMGAVFTLPIVHVSDLVESLTQLKQIYGTQIVAAHPHDATPIHEAEISGSVCVVFGNEGEGISQRILSVCDVKVSIPMMHGTDSLNVASASAVFLYEVRRGRSS